MSAWVQQHGSLINWIKGVRFSHEAGGLSMLTWEVAEVLSGGHSVKLTLTNKDNQTNDILKNYPLSDLKNGTYWFKEDTIKPTNSKDSVLAKIKYLDNRYATRNQQKPVSQVSIDW